MQIGVEDVLKKYNGDVVKMAIAFINGTMSSLDAMWARKAGMDEVAIAAAEVRMRLEKLEEKVHDGCKICTCSSKRSSTITE